MENKNAYLIRKERIYLTFNAFGEPDDYELTNYNVGIVYTQEQAIAACRRLNDSFDMKTDEDFCWVFDEEYADILEKLKEEMGDDTEWTEPYFYENISVVKEACI